MTGGLHEWPLVIPSVVQICVCVCVCVWTSPHQSSTFMCVCVFTCHMCFHMGSGERVAVASAEIRGFSSSCFSYFSCGMLRGLPYWLSRAWKSETERTVLSPLQFKVTGLLSLAAQIHWTQVERMPKEEGVDPPLNQQTFGVFSSSGHASSHNVNYQCGFSCWCAAKRNTAVPLVFLVPLCI